MKSFFSTISIFTSSSSTFVTQLIAVWILGKDDMRALLVLGAFMPFGFVLSSLSDSLRASALPIASGGDEDADPMLRTLMLLALFLFGTLGFTIAASSQYLGVIIDLPMLALQDFGRLLFYMTLVFGLITCSSVVTTVLYAKEKNILATVGIVISNVLNIAAVFYFVKNGYGVFSLVFAAILSSSCSLLIALTLAREARALVIPFRVAFGSLTQHIKHIAGIVIPIFTSYGLLVVWMFYLTHILLDYSEEAIAAFPLYMRVQNLIILLAVSVGVAHAIRYNKKVAEFDYSLLRTDTLNFALVSMAYLFLPVAGIYIFAEELAALLVNNSLVANEIAAYIKYVAPGLVVLSTYVGMTIYLEQTKRSKRAFLYNLAFIVTEILVIELLRPNYTESRELYGLLSIIFFSSSVFVVFEILKTRHEYNTQMKMQEATLC